MKNKSQEKIISRYKLLCQLLSYYNFYYYNKSVSLVKDETYDLLFNELLSLEQDHKFLARDPNSPTQNLNTQAPVGRVEVLPHLIRAYSLKKTRKQEEVLAFYHKYQRYGDIIVQPKIDGIAASLFYSQGKLLYGITRGDGYQGQAITQHLPYIADIPTSIDTKQNTLVRGELYLTTNKRNQLLKNHLSGVEEERNIVSGLMMRHESNPVLLRHLSFGVYDAYLLDEGLVNQYNTAALKLAKHCGFVPLNTLKVDQNFDVTQHKSMLVDANVKSDGLVYKLDNLLARKELGATSMYPRGMLAFKFQTSLYRTKIINVRLSISRYGSLNPIGDLEPVDVGGTITRFISLHNADFVINNQIGIGTEIFFTRAGGVIPAVKDVVNVGRLAVFKDIVCPQCGTPGVKEGVQWHCFNNDCKGKLICLLYYAVSKSCFDFKGFGKKVIERLVTARIIKKLSDLLKITKADLMTIPGFKEQTSINLSRSISKRAHISPERLLLALSIKGFGGSAIKTLLKQYPCPEQIVNLTESDLNSLEGIGPITAASVSNYFLNDNNKKSYLELLILLNLSSSNK